MDSGNIGVFLDKWWWDAVAGEGNWYPLEIKNNDELDAYLPVFTRNKWLKLISNPILTPHAGPWIRTKSENRAEQLSFEKAMINELMDKLPSGCSIDIRMDVARQYVLPFIWKGYQVKPCFTFQIDLVQPDEVIQQNMNSKFRKAIRDASKKLVLDENASFDEMIDLLDCTYKNQDRKNPIPRAIYKNIYDACNARKRGKLLIARDGDGRACVGCYLVFDDSTCYDLLNGRNHEIDKYFGMQFLIWESIKFAISRKCSTFDFEGSSIESIESFFRHAGGSPTCYFRVLNEKPSYKMYLWTKRCAKKIMGYK